MADRHVILKNGAKEIAESEGKAITFMAKWQLRPRRQFQPHPQVAVERRRQDAAVLRQEGRARHVDADASIWSPGQLKYASEITYFLAPYINSYKRFQAGTFAPTKIDVERDNRTAGFRLCGEGTKAHPHRMPHRRRRPQPLSRLRGADRGRPCRHRGEARAAEAASSAMPITAPRCREIPKTLRDATETLAQVEDAARGARRRRGRTLCPHRRVGAVRIRPPHHGLGTARAGSSGIELCRRLARAWPCVGMAGDCQHRRCSSKCED